MTARDCLCRLFEYFAIITLINQVGITVFRAIAAIGRAVVLCNVLAFVYIAYALLLCGFIIPLGTLPFFLHSACGCSRMIFCILCLVSSLLALLHLLQTSAMPVS